MCNKPNIGQDANTIVDHIEAFEEYSNHHVFLCSNLGTLSKKVDLNKFDVIIIHYSLCLLNNYYISKETKHRLREYKGLKVVFIQDEYRQINKMISELEFLKIDVLFTCFPESEINKIYKDDKLPSVSKYSNLTGYIPHRLTQLSCQTPMHKRFIHVGYRSRKIPFWLGELAYEKSNIVDKWHEFASRDDIKVDVSYHEKDRIYGKKWVDFLSSCKTTLGVESGASIMDFTGELEKMIDNHQLTNPNDSFYSVQKKYLLPYEGQYKLNQISPRCFEAIALKTVLVLYEGEYSNILIPGRHYISLKKDFSNIEEVLASIRDDAFLESIAEVAYQEIGLNPKYSYRSFVEHVDHVISAEFDARSKMKVISSYQKKLFLRDLQHISIKSKLYKQGLMRYQKLSPNLRLVVKGFCKPKSAFKYFLKRFYSALRPGE